ncbi:MAG TPA: tetratricopeptide repeat protein [Myxococcota bacterium]|nr:tetratricopeptide repeat protein [Myxococcota bacterium]
MRALHVFLFAAALTLALAGVGAATGLDQALASLRNAVAKHPDDPDVSWALADALDAAGKTAEAADQMQRHLARWPDRPAHGWLALGRCAYGAGRIDDAIAALSRALERDADDAEAHLYMGLALRQKGDAQGAETHFDAAARDPDLAPQALLLAGMSQVGRGEQAAGRAQLERVIELAPRSDAAQGARALLEDPAPSTLPFTIESFAGVNYDSNATLGSDGNIPGASSAEGDALFEFGTDLTWSPPLGGEDRPFELGLHYTRGDYVEQSQYSDQSVRGSVNWQKLLGPRLALRVDGAGGYTWLENEPYSARGSLRPSVLFELGPNAGVLRLYGSGERDEYENVPVIDSLERDGWLYGGGAEHLLRLGHESGTWFAWGGRYLRRDTEAQRDALGFASAYDANLWQGSLRLATTLPFEIRARAELFFDAQLYDHRNVIDALSEETDSPVRRRDLVWSSGLSFRRALYRGVDLELHGEFTDVDSNVGLYSYQRALTGMRLRAALP